MQKLNFTNKQKVSIMEILQYLFARCYLFFNK